MPQGRSFNRNVMYEVHSADLVELFGDRFRIVFRATGFANDILKDGTAPDILPLVSAKISVTSRADGKMIYEENIVSLRKFTLIEINTGLFDVLNNPNWVYERGFRNISVAIANKNNSQYLTSKIKMRSGSLSSWTGIT